jgi:fatty acid synthase, animal type
VNVVVSTSDVTTEQGCNDLIQTATKLGSVGGIFNLAVALRDGLLENQNVQMFKESLAPKAVATKYMDEISSKFCPQLEHFVVFSSVSCGRGNAGQSNYGLANSIMERIVENRHSRGLPAKAIQWGAVGDVGLLADMQEKNMDMAISGSLPQSIASCIDVLDLLLTSGDAIVASMVVAEKKAFELHKDNVIEALLNILGIYDKKSISMDSPLSKLGMDSLMTVEITQLLEREFSVFLTMKDLQTMTLHDLEQRSKGKAATDTAAKVDRRYERSYELELLLASFMSEAESSDTSIDTILCLRQTSSQNSKNVLVIPGIEGAIGEDWVKLVEKLDHNIFGLQVNNLLDAKNLKQIHDFVIQVKIN